MQTEILHEIKEYQSIAFLRLWVNFLPYYCAIEIQKYCIKVAEHERRLFKRRVWFVFQQFRQTHCWLCGKAFSALHILAKVTFYYNPLNSSRGELSNTWAHRLRLSIYLMACLLQIDPIFSTNCERLSLCNRRMICDCIVLGSLVWHGVVFVILQNTIRFEPLFIRVRVSNIEDKIFSSF